MVLGGQPEQRVHERTALKVLEIVDRLSDPDQPDRNL
jgi:hypothetical protein